MSEAMFRLDGKVALVTGAAGGFGTAISVALARQGADVALSDRPGVSLDEAAAKVATHGHRVATLAIDICDLAAIRDGVAAAERDLGSIDILVNNAGINRPAAGLEVTEANWDAVFDTNVKGQFFMAQAVASPMIARGWGRIIFLSSQSGLVAIAGQPVYCSSKAAVILLAKTLAVEWAKHGVTVNAIAPTFVETGLTRARLANQAFRQSVIDRIPAGKLALPEDVAAAATYLASPEAGMVTGTVLSVDGGWTAV
ncbi:MAG: glucose 1-dehydrogenase [Planctomycetes bacterium]|nr:glucose 1-dehydrogenase [Planctomycetota bacterium]